LGGDDVIAHRQICGGKLADGGVQVAHHIVRQVVAAHLHSGYLIRCDFLAQLHRLHHTDNLCLFADGLVEQRRDSKANDQRQQNADNADDGSVFQKIHKVMPSLVSKWKGGPRIKTRPVWSLAAAAAEEKGC
ncbi:Transposase, partial [Dysosmobacter welbionis]